MSLIVFLERKKMTSEALGEFSRRIGQAQTVKDHRQVGLRCETCNKTFTDSLAFTDHMHSKAHITATGGTLVVVHATLEEVRARLRELAAIKAKKDKRKRGELEPIDFTEEREEKKNNAVPVAAVVEPVAPEDAAMQQALGFFSFGGR